MKHEDCCLGQTVYYLPPHVEGDYRHKDVERGVVTGKNERYVFVRFGEKGESKACLAKNLGRPG